MVIIVALVALFAVFFLLRKNIGAALLATIAGLSVYEMFGKDLVSWISNMFDNPNVALIENIIYLVLVLALPLVLYLRSSHGGLFGLLRIAEAAVFAAILTSLCSAQLAYFFSFDQTAHDILNFIESIKSWILAGGIAAGYLDILLCKEV